ncbi:MAG: hypothetical protein E7H57_03780 [Pantoea sp.]|nr:hypothetical protein [Pantoea sp.]
MLSSAAHNVEGGNWVQVTLNGHVWLGRVDKNNEWRISLPPSTMTRMATFTGDVKQQKLEHA